MIIAGFVLAALAAAYLIFGRSRRKTLIRFECRGCMAEDWQERDRGVIVGRFYRNCYDGSSKGVFVPFYLVERPDGSRFDVLGPNCQPGTAEMQPRTDNPAEPLEGKIVCLE